MSDGGHHTVESPGTSGRITPLSRPTSTTLRSSLVIPTFPQVLSELIHNSLDAQATRIDCWLDISTDEKRIRVEDDGVGMDEAALKRIAKRYETSKRLSENRFGSAGTFGFRGEALSSIASLGLVEITTKTADSDPLTKVVKGSKKLFLGPSSRPFSQKQGTIVSVKDLFHNIPVRQNALSATSPSTTLTTCRKVIETLALVRPDVKWSLWEDHPAGSMVGGAKKILSLNGGKTSVEVFREVYGSAAVQRVQNVRVASAQRRIDGFISLEGAVTRAHQHLYINHYPVDRGDLHHGISKRFASSKFSTMTSDALDEIDSSNHKRRSPRRLERHPIYVLNVTLPHQDVDSSYGPQKTVMGYEDRDAVKTFVLAVIDEFLKRHEFAACPPPAVPVSKIGAAAPPTQSPRKRPAPSEEPFHPQTPTKRMRLVHPPIHTGSDADDSDEWLEEILEVHRGRSRSRSWTPRSLSPRKLHGRPLNTIHPAIEEEACALEPESCHHNLAPLPPRTGTKVEISLASSSLGGAKVLGQVDRKYIACIVDSALPDNSTHSLALVDQHAADERVSVERILEDLCEGFMRDNIPQTELTKVTPLVVLGREEADIIRKTRVLDILKRWGISLKEPEADAGDFAQISVVAVPTILLGRLGRKGASEMTRLLKLYLPILDESMTELGHLLDELEQDLTVDWGRALRWMPREMLDLANSKACRGAIMFEDRLNRDQYERLVRNLAQCRLPFVCAHGRPSLVPLVVLRGANVSGKRRIDWSRWDPAGKV